jgi:hypothetical protein
MGKSCLVKVEPSLMVICILHVLLRLVSNLWQATVVPHLSEASIPKILELLKQNNIHIPARKLKKIGKNFDLYSLTAALSKHNFTGANCLKLLLIHVEILDELWAGSNQTTSEVDTEVAGRALWQALCNFWVVLALEWDSEPGLVKEDQAQRVRKHAEIFVDLWSAHIGRNRSLYMHYIVAHLWQQIAIFGDLRPYSGQGLEHIHHLFKRILFNNTNRHTKDRIRQEAVAVAFGTINKSGLTDLEVQVLAEGKRSRKAARQERLCQKKGLAYHGQGFAHAS